MNLTEFKEVVDKQLERSLEVLTSKRAEYDRNENPLHTFEVGSAISALGETREEVIWSFARKHFISVQDIRNDLRKGILASRETIEEKYTDLINYMIIEKASLIDRHLRYEEHQAKLAAEQAEVTKEPEVETLDATPLCEGCEPDCEDCKE